MLHVQLAQSVFNAFWLRLREYYLAISLISYEYAGPGMVVYDNACNFHRYALRRAPRFFANTLFRIDRLHIFNHHG